MIEYIQHKYNWNQIEQSLIHWKGIEAAFRTYSEFRKTKIIQLMYNWQHDGEQKKLFHPDANEECPSKCGKCETHNHYLECQDESMRRIRQEKIRTVQHKLSQMNTHPLIKTTMIQMLTQSPENILQSMGEASDDISKMVITAIEENMHLSEFSFQKGFLSNKWHEAQTLWARSLGTNKSKTQQHWGRDAIVCIQSYT